MKRTICIAFRIAGISMLSFIVFTLLYLSGAYVCSRIAIGRDSDRGEDVAIYIKTNGVHTDIVVPVHTALAHWSHEVPYCNTRGCDTTCGYLAVGWGDKGFYLRTPTWADLKFSVAFNAAFWCSTTAMHATYYPKMMEGPNCRKIMISNVQYARLVQYIRNSFRQDEGGHFMNIPTEARYGNNDAFYEGTGTYSLFRTCNTWANTALAACGQKHCLWTIFDTPIFDKYR
ncbi:TIGR02117 family protein [Nemorincola caseinilytica]|uniref:TIGR02117 family protein n=1 Tax=Nemorincola caseinilytica TaxID=2054315 RepID=A0ABP8N4A7_9BACT